MAKEFLAEVDPETWSWHSRLRPAILRVFPQAYVLVVDNPENVRNFTKATTRRG